ncbi:MAG: hypothetical protein ACETVV_00620 [Nitrososphaeria archaeon]
MPRQDLTKQLTLFGDTRAGEKLVKKKYEALFWLLTRYTLKPAGRWTADFLKSRRGRELQFSHLAHKLAAIRDAKTRIDRSFSTQKSAAPSVQPLSET